MSAAAASLVGLSRAFDPTRLYRSSSDWFETCFFIPISGSRRPSFPELHNRLSQAVEEVFERRAMNGMSLPLIRQISP